MSISLRCVKCKKMYSLKSRVAKCNGCGASLKSSTATVYMVRCKLPSGSWKSKQVQTLDMAVKVEAKFKTQAIEEDVFNIKKAPLIDDIWEKYLKWATLHKRSWKDDESRWRLYINVHLKGRRMNKVTPDDIQGILNTMATSTNRKGKPYQPATLRQALILIKRFYNWSIERKYYYGVNPCAAIEAPKFDNKVTNPLDKKGIKALFKALDSWPNERATLVVRFALFSGKRRGEILKLTWDCIDLENGYITLQASNTKNKESQTVPLNENCLTILKHAQTIKISDDYVFPSNDGGYYHSFDRTWRCIRKHAGLSIRFHDLRHTYASHLASSGKVDIYTLKILLGHKTITMTQRYAHLIDSTVREAAGVADKVFSG